MPITRWSCLLAAISILAACSSSNPAYVAGQPCGPGAKESCGAGTVCDPQALICVCPPGAALCGESCPLLASDPKNCGACGLGCPAGQSCNNGRCSGGGCAIGAIDCGGICIDPKTNAQHCGGCEGAGGHRCDDGQACMQGVCLGQPCAFGATACPGGCVELASSATNCGACGKVCGPGSLCALGNCVGACPPGLTPCGAECVDLARDPNHCGSCGQVCSAGHVCAREEGKIKCREYRFSGCNSCPCPFCHDRACCVLASPGSGYSVLCVEDQCPAF